jgi:acyl-homoserine lactone acylase PvdQ
MRHRAALGRSRWRRGWPAAVVAAGLLTAPGGPAAAAAAPGGSPRAHSVTIRRDADAVVHRPRLRRGLGVLAGQLLQLANDVVTLEGERSRYFGPSGLTLNYSAGTESTNLDSDFFWRWVAASGIVDRTLHAAPPVGPLPQATSVAQLLEVESTYLAIPTFNTIAADDTGHALYADVGNTPNVPLSLIDTCTPQGAPKLVYAAAGVVTLDGSRSACAWRDDPGTPVPGIFDAAHEPHVIGTDYVENSNDSYWLANPSAPFPAYSPIIGPTGVAQDLRTRLGNQLIAVRVAGTDGLGPPKFTVPTSRRCGRATSRWRPSWCSSPSSPPAGPPRRSRPATARWWT